MEDYIFENNTIIQYLGDKKHLLIPDIIYDQKVKYISRFAFWWKGLRSVILPQHLIEIENGAFGINKLSKIVFPPRIEIIGFAAFRKNRLKHIQFSGTIPLQIESDAFYKNPLKSITLPPHVHIQSDTFPAKTIINQIQHPQEVSGVLK
jgi:hypothetical protein